jgi:hypothetical protein
MSIGNRDLHRQHGDSEVLMSEEAEAYFVLALREAAAHFACRNARFAEVEMGGSNYCNDHMHMRIGISTDLGIGFLPFFSKQDGKFLEKVLASLPSIPSVDTTKGEKCRRCSRQGSRGVSSFSRVHGLLMLCRVLWSGLTWHQHR